MPFASRLHFSIALLALLIVAIGCNEVRDDDDDDAVRIFGDGSHSLDSVELTVVADSDDDLDIPRDIAFHPDEPTELWIVNRGSSPGDEAVRSDKTD